jgi:hypothetical protein
LSTKKLTVVETFSNTHNTKGEHTLSTFLIYFDDVYRISLHCYLEKSKISALRLLGYAKNKLKFGCFDGFFLDKVTCFKKSIFRQSESLPIFAYSITASDG